MANEEHLAKLKSGVENWNKWRQENEAIIPDLSGVDLKGTRLFLADLSSANLFRANLSGADLRSATLSHACLVTAVLIGTDLEGATLDSVNLEGANMNGANLRRTRFYQANLTGADLTEANLLGANLTLANLRKTKLIGANLFGAKLSGATFIETDFTNTNIENTKVHGISVWDIKREGLKQKNLIITKSGDPVVTVDSIEVAQFIYLMLNNQKLRDIIDTIARKGVLILGRFTPERKKILDAIREKLREHDFVPIMFDFEKADSRDFTETIKILAGMSRFIIADITNPKNSPLELHALVPDYKIPFLTIIHKDEEPFSMFRDLEQYPWVLPPLNYGSEAGLLKGFQIGIIDEALKAEQKIFEKKQTPAPPIRDIENFGD